MPAGGDDAIGCCNRPTSTVARNPDAAPAAAVWTPEPMISSNGRSTGLTQFIAAADLQRIDRRLAQSPTAETSCAPTAMPLARRRTGMNASRWSVGRRYRACEGDTARCRGNTLSGRMRRRADRRYEFGALSVGGSDDAG